MNDSLIRKFCDSRHRWLMVGSATGLFALATVLPMVDDYCNKRSSRNDLTEELAAARQTAELLPLYEKQTGAVARELGALEARTVDDASMARFRSRLVDLVRDSGCQIRRIEVAAPTRRPWKDNDQPLSETGSNEAADTAFSLERRSMILAVDGSMAAIHELLEQLEKERTIAHPHRLQLQPNGVGEAVTLELEVWMFSLHRAAA